MYFVYFSEANSLLKDIMSVFTRIPQMGISWKAPQDVPEQLGSPTPMLTFILKYTIAASWFGPKEGAVVHLFTTLALTEVSLLPWGFAQRLNPILVIPFLSCQQKVQIFTYPVKFDAHILIPFNKTLGSHFYFSSIVSFYAPDTFCSWLKSSTVQKSWDTLHFIHVFLEKWQINATVYRNVYKHEWKYCIKWVITSLKLSVWYEDFYSSTEPKLFRQAFFFI